MKAERPRRIVPSEVIAQKRRDYDADP